MQPAGNHTAASGLCKPNNGGELTVAVSTAGAVCGDAIVVVVVTSAVAVTDPIFTVVAAAAIEGDLIT